MKGDALGSLFRVFATLLLIASAVAIWRVIFFPSPKWPETITLSCIITAISIGLAYVKKSRFQLWYGAVEITVAFVATVYLIKGYNSETTSTKLAGLVGIGYVTRRGVDNVLDGKDKPWRRAKARGAGA